MVTDRKEDASPPKRRRQLLDEESQESSAYNGEIQVVYHEQGIQLERWPVPHELSSTQHSDIVRYKHSRSRRERRHGCLPGHKPEVLRRVAFDGGEELVENWP